VVEPGQFAVDPAVAPAGVVRGHPQHQLPDGRSGRWPAAAAGDGPAAADQVAVPAKDRVGGDEQPGPAAAWDESAQRGLDGPVGPGWAGSGDLPAEHRELVAQEEDFGVL
jgi:hypothetical protein